MTDKSHLLRFGYAPGEYGHGQCVDCEQKFFGDKYARRCETCAETLYSQVSSVEAVADKHRTAPMTIPEQAVQAAAKCYLDRTVSVNETASSLAHAMLTAAAPHLASVRVNIDEIVQPLEDIHAPGGLCRWTDVATAIGEVRRALSALEPSADDCPCTKTQQDETCPVGYPSLLCEICDGKGVVKPSAARELALEEALRKMVALYESEYDADVPFKRPDWLVAALSRPDHANAGKVEGDGCPQCGGNGEIVVGKGRHGDTIIDICPICSPVPTRPLHPVADKPDEAGAQGEVKPVAYLRPKDIERLAAPGVSGAINVQIANTPFIGCTVPVFVTLPTPPSSEVA